VSVTSPDREVNKLEKAFMRKIILTGLAVLVMLALVVVTRTLMFTPSDAVEVATVELALEEHRLGQNLAAAIRFRTISNQPPTPLDPVPFEGFIKWLNATYSEVVSHLEQERLGGYSLLFTWQGSNPELKPILLTAHYDVVPVIPGTEELWTHQPFSGDIEAGVVWGRGALDDKSAVIAMLEAATLLLKDGFQPERTVYFSFGHDEEIGGNNGAGSVVDHLASKGVQLLWSLDEGSFLLRGMLPGIEPLVAPINVAEKGYMNLDIVAKAQGGHSSIPPRETAVGRLADAIIKLENSPLPGGLTGVSAEMFDILARHMSFGQRMLFANQWLFGGILEQIMDDVGFANAMMRTTTAPTMLSASVKENVLPIEAIARVNFRLHPRDTVESVHAHVSAAIETEFVEVRIAGAAGGPASAVSSWTAQGYADISRSIREIYGDAIITPGLMVAGSDTKHYGKIADDSYRFNPMALAEKDMSGFHGTNENISVENLAQATRTYVRLMTIAAGGR
jgi:carboxypeptidase PM20D1